KFDDAVNDIGSATSGADDYKLTADDKGNNHASHTVIKSWSAPGQSCSNTITDSVWGDDKDHSFSDTISLNGTVTGLTGNGWRDDKAGHRVDASLTMNGPGAYQSTNSGYGVESNDD